VGQFEQVAAPERGRKAITAGYQFITPSGGVAATVQRRTVVINESLLPELDMQRADANETNIVDAELQRSVAQVRHFYPDAVSSAPEKFLLSREGQLHPGRRVRVTYHDAGNSELQTTLMDVNVVCCTSGGEVVEYRFRHAPGVMAEFEQIEFIRNFPWSSLDLGQSGDADGKSDPAGNRPDHL